MTTSPEVLSPKLPRARRVPFSSSHSCLSRADWCLQPPDGMPDSRLVTWLDSRGPFRLCCKIVRNILDTNNTGRGDRRPTYNAVDMMQPTSGRMTRGGGTVTSTLLLDIPLFPSSVSPHMRRATRSTRCQCLWDADRCLQSDVMANSRLQAAAAMPRLRRAGPASEASGRHPRHHRSPPTTSSAGLAMCPRTQGFRTR